ncbi:MAG TPA: hypothetical protein VMU75_13590 [Acidimicrobiales bacterium]|nr:hypothetical protein [Acidimicrobiales bacterium]
MDEVTVEAASDTVRPPGVCIPWEQKMQELGTVVGDPGIIQREWEQLDAAAYVYLWWWVHR